MKLSVVLIVVALLTASYGAAALTSISIDRTVAAGTVLADTDSNVAVKFEAIGTYATVGGGANPGVLVQDGNGKVSIDLSKILTTATGFNTEAQFQIGSTSAYVFKITNNSDIAVKVTLTGVTGGLELYDTTGKVTTGTTIGTGSNASFYFKINSAGVAKTTNISGTLHVGV